MEKTDPSARKRFPMVRMAALIGVLVLITTLGIMHQYGGATRPVGVDALCPFGGLESFFAVVNQGVMLQRVAASSFILMGAVILVAILFRRAFCGSVCPLGTLQELAGMAGRKLFKKQLVVPKALDRVARLLKYLALAVIIALTFALGDMVIRPYDPWVTWMHLTSAEVFTEFTIGLVILVLTLAGSLVYDRFFCKYLCPMGAFLGILSPLSIFKIRRNADTCTNCKACDKACPVNLKVSEAQTVRHAECINCNLCVAACPAKNTLQIAGPAGKTGKRPALSPLQSLALVFGILAVVVGTASLAGTFRWNMAPLSESLHKEAPGTQVTEPAQATAQEPAQVPDQAPPKPQLDPAEIKGSHTFREVSDLTGIPKEEFMATFKISDEEFEGQIKKVAHRATDPHETEEVREFVRQKQAP